MTYRSLQFALALLITVGLSASRSYAESGWGVTVTCPTSGKMGSGTFTTSGTYTNTNGSNACTRLTTSFNKFVFGAADSTNLAAGPLGDYKTYFALNAGDISVFPPMGSTEDQVNVLVQSACLPTNVSKSLNWIYVKWNKATTNATTNPLTARAVLGRATLATDGVANSAPTVTLTGQYDVDPAAAAYWTGSVLMSFAACSSSTYTASGTGGLGGTLYITQNAEGTFWNSNSDATFFMPQYTLNATEWASSTMAGVFADSADDATVLTGDIVRPVRVVASGDGFTLTVRPYSNPDTGAVLTNWQDSIALGNLNTKANGMMFGTVTRTIFGDTTNTSTTLTNVASTTLCGVGKSISGTGIPLSTTIVSCGASTIGISQAATATNVGVSLTIAGGTGKLACIGALSGASGFRILCAGQSPADNNIPYSLSIQGSAETSAIVSGSSAINSAGSYGSLNTTASSNVPPSRQNAFGWIDSSDNLYVFGGYGFISPTTYYYNDLWKFNGTSWTWIKGSNGTTTPTPSGTYANADPTLNIPGGRFMGATARKSDGTLWLFGGTGYDSAAALGELGDLWNYTPSTGNWTYVKGFTAVGSSSGGAGVYGTKGTAAAGNKPGARKGAAMSFDSNGNLWLFGGYGVAATWGTGPSAGEEHLSDLWKFNGTDWTWVSGPSTKKQAGTYGTQGTAAAANVPGGRKTSVMWIDGTNKIWIFGGDGWDTQTTTLKQLNDLWKFDGTNWTWVKGSNAGNAVGVYGTKGTPASTNVPGARRYGTGIKDSLNRFWLIGGYGYDATTLGSLGDFWLFDGTNWTFMGGTSTVNTTGTCGSTGATSATYYPSARDSATSFKDSHGSLWMFGGYGPDCTSTTSGYHNDLWRYDP